MKVLLKVHAETAKVKTAKIAKAVFWAVVRNHQRFENHLVKMIKQGC